MALHKKLLKLQMAVTGLLKDAQGNAGAYVSGNKILSIVRPKMDELGLILVPEVLESSFTRQDYAVKSGQKSEMFCALKIKFTWIDTDTGEKQECLWASSGMNGFDKGYGSALTYGERYFLLKYFHIQTDKDDVDAPKTPEQEMTVQNAIAYINGLKTAQDMQAAWQYYSQFAIGKDKDFIKAYNKHMKELNDAANGHN